MASTIKRNAIPASGYRYQALVGLQYLLGWLEYPDRYRWVKFEADDELGAQGLDDIVYERPDGLKGLVQVKFTVNADDPRHALDWAWLTHRVSDRSRSLLQKWSEAAFRVGLDNAAELCLITNRRPDAEFEASLQDGRISLDILTLEQRAKVIEQFGNEQSARHFFERFEFRHSYPGYLTLERSVSEAFGSRHTDRRGFLELDHCATDWSIHKNTPAPDGRITLSLIRSVISPSRPRPLDQAFKVPTGYEPPDSEFARDFVASAIDGSWSLRVLWGSPGQGKSTFVSYVCGQLRQQGLKVCRHHYFLDLTDASDRFSLSNVAYSLIEQMRSALPEEAWQAAGEPENLREWIEASADVQAREGKRFFVFIDGLDHVWRENDRDLEPMEALFKHLLPLPENATLILGTQRVDASQLARRLQLYVDATHWIELPRMRAPAVKAWLAAKHAGDTVQPASTKPSSDALGEVALALHKASSGHPLVLTYTFLALRRSGRELSVEAVEDLVPTPLEDAGAYYRNLWIRLSPPAKDALHLMASDELIWPRGGLEACLKNPRLQVETELGHLLTNVEAGLIAFHGSLYVFIAAQPDHQPRVQALAGDVETWLAEAAPSYLRWAWLWIYQGRRGAPGQLIAGTTRSWAVDALALAYPVHQMIRILEDAEEAAFVSGNFGLAVHRRSLKRHLAYGLDHQLDDSGKLEDAALELTTDPYPALLLDSEVRESGVGSLHQLAMLYLSMGHGGRAGELLELMGEKIADRFEMGRVDLDDYDRLIDLYLEVAAGTGTYEPTDVIALLLEHSSGAEVFERFLGYAGQGRDPTPLLAFVGLPMQSAMEEVLELELLRTAAWCGAAAHSWDEFGQFGKHPLSICWALVYGNEAVANRPIPARQSPSSLALDYSSHSDDDIAPYLYTAFFDALARSLQRNGAAQQALSPQVSTRSWLTRAFSQLIAAADRCGAVFAKGGVPSFSSIYETVDLGHPAPNDSKSWADERSVQRALVSISADLFLLSRRRSGLSHVPASEWRKCKKSELFSEYHFRTKYLTRHYLLLDQSLVRSEIEAQAAYLQANVQRFNEKASESAELCLWAHASGLDDLASQLLKGAYRTAISYGSRKDWRMPQILDSVVEVSRHDPDTGRWAVRALAPIYVHLDDMTEKTGASPSDLAAPLLDLMPDAFPEFYAELLGRGQWYEAEQAFAVFAKRVDLASPEARVALAFLWESPVWHAVARRASEAPEVAGSLLAPWERSQIKPADDDGRSHRNPYSDGEVQPPMQDVSRFGPDDLQSLMAEIEATGRGSLVRSQWLSAWFDHWMAEGRWRELLKAITPTNESGLQSVRTVGLLDRAFEVSRERLGPAKSFDWLVHAQRYSRGWNETYRRDTGIAHRLALVAADYADRWEEFVRRSTPAAPGAYESGRVIPDVALVSLMLQVGEVQRAAALLRDIVSLILEEFEIQPMDAPTWLGSLQ